MKTGRCPLCGTIIKLQKHHYIPQRIKKIDHFVYICQKCHQKIHPENDVILEAKYTKTYLHQFKRFIKHQFPEAWTAWLPTRAEIKKKFRDLRKKDKIPEIIDD